MNWKIFSKTYNRGWKKSTSLLILAFLIANLFPIQPSLAATRQIAFPVIGLSRYSNDFGAPRTGRTHEGNDIFGVKGQPLVAAVDGSIRYVPFPEPAWGYSVTLEDEDGYRYNYYHINNDNPGTDDGQGGGMFAYAPETENQQPVIAGQVIGYMGDSGNAEGTPPHLHFEIRSPDGEPINPFESLNAATRLNQAMITPVRDDELLPFGLLSGGASIALGDVSGRDGIEIIAGAGQGGGPQVRIFDLNKTLIGQFFAFETTFRGGIDTATGDINGDGQEEIIVGAGPGREPEVRIFNLAGEQLFSFMAYPETFRGGVQVSTVDIKGDGISEIITGTGPGGGPQVRIFDASGILQGQFFAFAASFRGGVNVAGISATGDQPAYVVTAASRGGGPHIRVFDTKGNLQNQFFAYGTDFRGGVKVAAADVIGNDGQPEIITVPQSAGGANFRQFSLEGQLDGTQTAFEEWWRGGYDIAASTNDLRVVSVGGRRTSIRNLISPSDFSNDY